MSSTQDQVLLETRGRIAIITLNRPAKLNAVEMKLCYRLSCLMREVAARSDVFITVLTGRGRYFSAVGGNSGADVTQFAFDSEKDVRETALRTFVSNNLDLTHAFYTHPKILVTALNGPAIGILAAVIAFSDFIYAVPDAFLLTPFTTLGLVTEGGASRAFVQRMGIGKANEALIMSKKITAQEMLQVGFVNKIFEVTPAGSERFLEQVLEEVEERLGDHLNGDSMLQVKALMRRPEREIMGSQNVAEVMAGLERFASGVPLEEFQKIASGEKKHKL